MSREQITQDLLPIFHEVFNDESIVLHDEMTTNDISAWDSLTHLRLIMQIEKTFHIKFSTADIKRTENVGALITVIESYLQKQDDR